MPELPEVQTVLDGLVKTLREKEIKALDCHYQGTVIHDPEIIKPAFPARTTAFARRGKYMILTLDSGNSLIIHLRMTGKLVHTTTKCPPDKHERACFVLTWKEAVHFIDPRTFGKIVVCNTKNVANYLPKLGAEPLDVEFDHLYLKHMLSGRKAPIKNIMLDQRIIAGLGNIYVSEILYRSGVRPDRPAGKITDKELKAIVKDTKAVLREAIAKNGTSISDFRRIDDKSGEFQNFLKVYQKQQCPLGHDIEVIRLAGRGSFFCPICQK
ncbi:MAG: bifunctional DNA-formamidopyrimidine glycosylase/DNA-(apurinic or apyrimidinic site) lyase [Candidatus Cloacimonadaceae bacterium]|nr:bifunctional DNA-formamidopyrimidine glycosylase/DNA-(apurinic or apyrimidinic site) lyase [Candidatus Cloacimonadaceae bacterium]